MPNEHSQEVERTCSLCELTQPLDNYSLNRTSRGGRTARCKTCLAKLMREQRKKTPRPKEVRHAENRRDKLKRRYGITVEQYDQFVTKQGGACAVCGTKEPGGRNNTFHVDHSHTSGAVRGLLCAACNQALGYMGDTLPNVMRFVNYLRRRGEGTIDIDSTAGSSG